MSVRSDGVSGVVWFVRVSDVAESILFCHIFVSIRIRLLRGRHDRFGPVVTVTVGGLRVVAGFLVFHTRL